MVDIRWAHGADEATLRQIRGLLSAVRDVDGRPELVEGRLLPSEFTGGAHLLARDAEELVGYAHLNLDGDAFGYQVGELLVHPAHREKGIGAAMTREITDGLFSPASGDLRSGKAQPGKLRMWSHGDHPAAAKLAAKTGFVRARELLVLHRGGDSTPLPDLPLPKGIQFRTFEAGRDEQAVAEVNGRAFSWHPEQGMLTAQDILDTERENWFDPKGFFLAEDLQGHLLGFHWTKIHPRNPQRFAGEPVGEVYVLGVDPQAQGTGLGRALTVKGLDYLQSRGLEQVILYVEGDNSAAIGLYRKLGFDLFETDVQYELDG
jgi:mycothiol synthase